MIDYPEYDSPLKVTFTKLASEIADNIDAEFHKALMQGVYRVGIDVDEKTLIEALKQDSSRYIEAYRRGYETDKNHLYNRNQVAEIIADLFGDPCACNFNNIDEWLPERCDFRDTCCPDPDGVACWEQYLKHKDDAQGGAE